MPGALCVTSSGPVSTFWDKHYFLVSEVGKQSEMWGGFLQVTQLVSGGAGIQEQTFCSKPGSQSRPGPASGGRGAASPAAALPPPCQGLCQASKSRRAALLSDPRPVGDPWGILAPSTWRTWGSLGQGREMEGQVLCLHLAAGPRLGGPGPLACRGSPRLFLALAWEQGSPSRYGENGVGLHSLAGVLPQVKF